MRLGVGEELRVSAVLSHLLLHAVNVAANGLSIHDVLTVHGEFDAQHAMGGRMLGPQVNDKRLSRPGSCGQRLFI